MAFASSCSPEINSWHGSRRGMSHVAAMVSYNFKLFGMQKLVIVTSINQEDLIHHKLRRRPHPLADVKWKILICLQHVSNHLVHVVRGLLILEQLNRFLPARKLLPATCHGAWQICRLWDFCATLCTICYCFRAAPFFLTSMLRKITVLYCTQWEINKGELNFKGIQRFSIKTQGAKRFSSLRQCF